MARVGPQRHKIKKNDEIYDISDLLGKVNILTVGNTAFHPNRFFFCNHRTVH